MSLALSSSASCLYSGNYRHLRCLNLLITHLSEGGSRKRNFGVLQKKKNKLNFCINSKARFFHRNSEITAMAMSWKGRRILYTSRPNFLWGHSVPCCHQPCYPPSTNTEGIVKMGGFPTGMRRVQTFIRTAVCRTWLTQSPSTWMPREMYSVP